VTAICTTSSPQLRGWPKPENRGLVSFGDSFAEYAPEPGPETKKTSSIVQGCP
jgi:hypothetical protein